MKYWLLISRLGEPKILYKYSIIGKIWNILMVIKFEILYLKTFQGFKLKNFLLRNNLDAIWRLFIYVSL